MNLHNVKTFLLLLVGMAVFPGCKSTSAHPQHPDEPLESTEQGLKDYYSDYFTMGVAVAPASIKGASAQLIKKEFSSITPENVMKMGPIHPEEDRFFWDDADVLATFAQENNLKMRGHALVWHQQAGNWIFRTDHGEKPNKEELLKRMKTHINTVVPRYKETIYAWDVVNEAISDDPDEFLRNSPWYEIAGEDFITKAFEYAREADPDAKLFYNDYNAVTPEKRDRIYKLLKMLIDTNVPIDGMGIQGHWSIYGPSEQELREALDMYASLGLEIQITELDVSIYPWEKERRKIRPDETDAFTPELEQRQLETYEMFFRVFRDYKDVLTGVTFWNVSDKYSWLDFYPVEGRKNYPLLFDQDFNRKKAYKHVIDFKDQPDSKSSP